MQLIYRALDAYAHDADYIMHGNCSGADSLAGYWAEAAGIQEIAMPANRSLYKNGAGYVRNRAMLALGPSLVITFPGGKGTAMMVRMAEQAGIPVINVVA